MTSPMSDAGLKRLEWEILHALEHERDRETKLNRERTAVGKPPLKLFYLGQEIEDLKSRHAAGLAALAEAERPERPKFYWSRAGEMSPRAGATASEAWAEGVGAQLDLTLPLATLKAALADPRIDDLHLRELCKIITLAFAGALCGEPDPARDRAVSTWLNMAATNFGRNPKRVTPPDAPPRVKDAKPVLVVATPEMVERAAAKRDGLLVEMPSDPVARAVIVAGRKRRAEEDKPL